MDKINWDKTIALEIIQAGFIRMAKKYHPDVGGTQEQVLALQATKEHLEKLLSGGRAESPWIDRTQARSEPRTEWRTRWRTPPPAEEFTGDVPLDEYADDTDYVCLRDVTIMSFTEKAYRIKIPGVKQGQWLPKSQMLMDYEFGVGDVVTIAFTKWIAKQKGWMK